MTYFAYFRCSNKKESSRLDMRYEYRMIMKKFNISLSSVVVEITGGHTAITERIKFIDLVERYMRKGDVIVVPDLSCLGGNAIDIQLSLALCLKRGLGIVCYSFSEESLFDLKESIFWFVDAFSTLEDETIKAKVLHRKLTAESNGKHFGRPEGSRHFKAIQQAKQTGLSQRKVAIMLNISIATVKRNWRNGIIE